MSSLPGVLSAIRLGALLALASAPSEGQSQAMLALSEREMQTAAERLLTSKAAIAQIWPGFWQPPAFAMYLQDSVAFLYSEGGAPTSFVAVDPTELPQALRGRWYRRSGGIPGLRGGILPVDPRARPLALAVDAGANWATPFLDVMVHESFHGFQIRRFEPEPDSIPARLTDADSLSAAALQTLAQERQHGLRALRATKQTGRRAAARAYLVARASRPLTAAARMVERRHERWEGIATYVGVSGLLATEGLGRAVLADSLADRLAIDWRWGIGARSADAGTHTRAYQSGALLAFLLDELRCADWKNLVERGGYLDELLARCLDNRN